MSAIPELLLDRDGEILVLTLNRPAAANAMNQAMHEALIAALDRATDDATTRAVLITASGDRVFSAGADQKEFSDRPPLEAGRTRRALLVRTLACLLDHPKPIVCAVQGKAIGAGWMVALAADEIVASDAASFSLPEVRHGMPTPIGATLLAARVTRAQCHRFVQTGATIAPAEAVAHGLIELAVPAADLRAAALARARLLGAIDPAAYAVNKRWLNRTVRMDLDGAAVIADQASVSRSRSMPVPPAGTP